MEQWKPVVGFESQYDVSNRGRVRRRARTVMRSTGASYKVSEKVLSPVTYGHKRLYLGIGFKVAPKTSRVFGVDRLVAEAFLPNPEQWPDVNHKNLDKLDNRVENLEWCTKVANQEHAAKRGRFHGRTNPNARYKLQPEQVDAIQAQLAAGASQALLAAEYGVSRTMISMIKTGRTWAQPAEVYAHVV